MFNDDLLGGRVAEDIVKRFLEQKKGLPVISAPDECFKAWDLRVDMRGTDEHTFEYRYEIKWDKLSWKTGNIAVEFMNKKRSGLLATRADFWIFIVTELEGFKSVYTLYGMETNVLREELVMTLQGKEGSKIVSGGDKMLSQILLIPITRLKQLAHSVEKLDALAHEQLRAVKT